MIPSALEWPQLWPAQEFVCTLLNSEPSYVVWKDSGSLLVKPQVTAQHRPAPAARNAPAMDLMESGWCQDSPYTASSSNHSSALQVISQSGAGKSQHRWWWGL